MITIDLQNHASVQQRLKMLELSPVQQRRLLTAVSREAMADNKQRVKNQTLADGGAFTPRSAKTPARQRRKKMLVKAGTKLTFLNVTDDSVLMGWKGRTVGRTMSKHQYGDTQTKTRANLSRRVADINTAPATKKQAHELLYLGYKISRASGRGYKTPTAKWITENMTVAKAGAVLHALRGDGKRTWQIVLPARPAFGFSDADIQKYIQVALDFLDRRVRGVA